MEALHIRLMKRKWLLCLNVMIGFLLIYLVGYQPPSSLITIDGWIGEYTTISGEGNSIIPCTLKKNVFFLKTHKCASSSVQNILLRYAHQKNLTVVVPVLAKDHYLSVSKPFSRNAVAKAPWEILGYNILCHHMVFNQHEVEKLMPKDTVYISIVRNPASLFESMYEYGKLEKFYKMDIEEYARATRNATPNSLVWQRHSVCGRNPMLFDFGANPNFNTNRKYIEEAIEKIDKRFDFIMLSERFDESVVILRHLLCWSLDEVISLTVNARLESFKKTLSEEAVIDLQNWHWGDQMLYDHFVAKFEKTVQEFGPERLARETEELRRRRQEWFDNCVEETVGSKNLTAYKIWSRKVVAFKMRPNVTDVTCQDLVKPENAFTNEIRQLQILRALEKGALKTPFVYRLLDPSKLKGRERDIAVKYLASYRPPKRRRRISRRG